MHWGKGLLPINTTFSGMTISERESHSRNAPSLIIVTDSGIFILFNDLQPLNVLNIDNQLLTY